MLTADFQSFLSAASSSKPLQAGIIITGTFILEDAATLLAAMQVTGGAISLPLALSALYAGIILGDLGLYGLGRLSGGHPWAKRLVPAKRRNIGRHWAAQRMFPIVIVSRFIPGLRLPTYTTLGFLRISAVKFAAAAILATLLWTSLLFVISLKLGGLLLRYLGVWRWAGLAVFCVIIFMAGRFASQIYNNRNGT